MGVSSVPSRVLFAQGKQTELDHFGNCPHCGVLVDMREVIAHVHDRWEEITEDG
jgi:hypothetical protein